MMMIDTSHSAYPDLRHIALLGLTYLL